MKANNDKKIILEVVDLCKDFGSTKVLQGISFTVNKGEILSIIGSSGSGKTTLLRCLNFLEDADSGLIKVDDEVLFEKDISLDSKSKKKSKVKLASVREKRLNFGMVFQNFNLFPQYTVLKNVMLPLVLQGEEIRSKKIKLLKLEKKALIKSASGKEEMKAALLDIDEKMHSLSNKNEVKKEAEIQARELLSKVGLDDKIDSYPCELSGGQQQRVAIARAMALKPKIICFDEPTSALDPELTGEVLKVIKNLRSSNRTMIIVTHEMSFAREISDKVIFMADGVIEEMGTPEEVFDRPKSQKTKNFLLMGEDSMEELC